MPTEPNLLDYFFGGIIANMPLWIFTLVFTNIDPFSLTTLFVLTVLGLIGGMISGYIIKLKNEELFRYAPLATGSLAFFASVLILESTGLELIDFILLPAFIAGTYFGVIFCKRYPIRLKSWKNFSEVSE